jgi:hypothetical protein
MRFEETRKKKKKNKKNNFQNEAVSSIKGGWRRVRRRKEEGGCSTHNFTRYREYTHHTFDFVPLTNFSLYTPAIELKHDTIIIVVIPVAI